MSDWIFDPGLPSGSRSGGNAANEAFDPQVGTFVREVLQNARDARSEAAEESGEPVEVNFTLKELSSEDTSEFLEAVGWDWLSSHLKAAAVESNDKSLQENLDRLQSDGSLTLLRIDDRNTTGLTGAETGDDGNSKYAALCRDELYSEKSSRSSGGTHGLGKAVLWHFSAFSTVLFNSNLASTNGVDSPRLVGRSILPWHQFDGNSYNGGGWFGKPETLDDDTKRAVSIQGSEATDLASDLYLSRNGDNTGTSILVVGFSEPAAEERSLEERARLIKRAAAKWFWPCMQGSDPSLEVSVRISGEDGDEKEGIVDPSDYSELVPFLSTEESCRENNLVPELGHPGDVAAREIEVDIPAREDGEFDAETVSATLAVRLASPKEESNSLCNNVAQYRGAGMVVRYRPFKSLSPSARPFQALLMCGEADGQDSPSPALEYFLRAAEPPEHDRWKSTKNLKNEYKQGYAKALKKLRKKLREELRYLVTKSPADSGDEGPSRLMKKFYIGSGRSGGDQSRTFVTMRKLVASVDGDDLLSIEGKLRARSTSPDSWKAEIDFRFAEEDARKGEKAPVQDFEVDGDEVEWWHDNGKNKVTLLVPEGNRVVDFTCNVNTAGTGTNPDFASIEATVLGHELDE